jgi:hypothetical protein
MENLGRSMPVEIDGSMGTNALDIAAVSLTADGMDPLSTPTLIALVDVRGGTQLSVLGGELSFFYS